MEKAGGQDPGGPGVQELPPRRARPARCRVDARGPQDLLDGRRRNGGAEPGQVAVDPPVAPQRVLPSQADGYPGDAPDRRRAAGPAARARVVLPRGQPAVPGQQRRGRDREDPCRPPPRHERGQRSEPGPIRWLVPDPAGVPAQHRVLMPEHQQPGVLRPVPAEHQRNQPEYPAHQQIRGLQRHPASQPSPHQARSHYGRSTRQSSIRAAHHPARAAPVLQGCYRLRQHLSRLHCVWLLAQRARTRGPPQHRPGVCDRVR